MIERRPVIGLVSPGLAPLSLASRGFALAWLGLAWPRRAWPRLAWPRVAWPWQGSAPWRRLGLAPPAVASSGIGLAGLGRLGMLERGPLIGLSRLDMMGWVDTIWNFVGIGRSWVFHVGVPFWLNTIIGSLM